MLTKAAGLGEVSIRVVVVSQTRPDWNRAWHANNNKPLQWGREDAQIQRRPENNTIRIQ